MPNAENDSAITHNSGDRISRRDALGRIGGFLFAGFAVTSSASRFIKPETPELQILVDAYQKVEEDLVQKWTVAATGLIIPKTAYAQEALEPIHGFPRQKLNEWPWPSTVWGKLFNAPFNNPSLDQDFLDAAQTIPGPLAQLDAAFEHRTGRKGKILQAQKDLYSERRKIILSNYPDQVDSAGECPSASVMVLARQRPMAETPAGRAIRDSILLSTEQGHRAKPIYNPDLIPELLNNGYCLTLNIPYAHGTWTRAAYELVIDQRGNPYVRAKNYGSPDILAPLSHIRTLPDQTGQSVYGWVPYSTTQALADTDPNNLNRANDFIEEEKAEIYPLVEEVIFSTDPKACYGICA